MLALSMTQASRGSYGDGKPGHVLLVSYPAQGHMLPLLDLFRPLMASLAALRQHLLAWCKAQTRSITTVISDLFAGWTLPLAEELGVRHVTFLCCSVLYTAVSQNLWRHLPRRRRLDEMISFPDVPGLPSFPWDHLSWLFRMHVAGDEVSETIRQLMLWSFQSSCFVVNSLAALEGAYLESPMPKRVFAVGALSEAVVHSSGDRGGKPAVPPADVAAWLDTFDDGSVIYVCFGTQNRLLPLQAAGLADALGRSSAAFVWAVASGTVVPEGFEASRGMVIRGWAPQVAILRHRAMGWFLTHCRWGSVLEAASAGVAMLTWPTTADHFMAAWLLARAGVAMPVAEGLNAVPDPGEIARAIGAAATEEGMTVRERAVELGRKARVAVAEGSTSYRD